MNAKTLFAALSLFAALTPFASAANNTIEPSCCAPPEPACSYNPCIRYIDKARCCESRVETALLVKDPCTCCDVVVPVCVPACCLAGEPCVKGKIGPLGNGKLIYKYDCGYIIKLVLDKRGNVTVIYLDV